MVKWRGFTLIELLLVLAIIGIIGAIAIPALLGSRSRSKDKVSQYNTVAVFSEVLAAVGKHYEESGPISTVEGFNVSIIGSNAGHSKVPMVWNTLNPWYTADARSAYRLPVFNDALGNGLSITPFATEGVKGQVQMGWMPPRGEQAGCFSAAVYLHNGFQDVSGATQHVFVRRSDIE